MYVRVKVISNVYEIYGGSSALFSFFFIYYVLGSRNCHRTPSLHTSIVPLFHGTSNKARVRFYLIIYLPRDRKIHSAALFCHRDRNMLVTIQQTSFKM